MAEQMANALVPVEQTDREAALAYYLYTRSLPAQDEIELVARTLCEHFDEDWSINGSDWLDAATAVIVARG